MSAYSFTKLFSSITKSTVWCEPHTTLRVWITMLADCDCKGRLHASIPGLANLARVTVPECESALATFLAPDSYSRTPDHEGRRIEEIEGGWKLLNYDHYRELRDPDARKEQNREAQRRSRERQQVSGELLTDDDKSQESAQAEDRSQKSEESKGKEQKRSRGSRLPDDWSPSDEELKWAAEKRADLSITEEVEKFRDYWTDRTGKDATKLDWRGTWKNWIRNAHAPFKSKPSHESLTDRSARENRAHDLREGGHAVAR